VLLLFVFVHRNSAVFFGIDGGKVAATSPKPAWAIDARQAARHALPDPKAFLVLGALPIRGDLPMRSHPLALAALLTGMLLASGGQGADNDEPMPQFPKAGSYLPGPFHVLNLTGERKGRYHCLICRNSTLPVIALLVRLGNDDDAITKELAKGAPLTNLLTKIDRVLDKNPDGNLAGFAIFFADPDGDATPVDTRLHGLELTNTKSLLKEADIKHLIFGFDTKGSCWKYFQDTGASDKKGPPKDPIIRVLMYHNYKLVYDARDFTKDKPLTDKDVDQIIAELIKMQPPPVVNRKKPKA
jgi:hypothetical protein